MPRAHAKQIPSISVEDEEGLCSSVMLRNRWRLDGHPEDAGLVGDRSVAAYVRLLAWGWHLTMTD